ncbi:MAG: hypothetical protein WCO02_07960 [Bacteroidota bacterium]
MISRYSIFICLVFLIAVSACNKGDTVTNTTYSYAGAGSVGDVLNFTVNESVMSYTVYNESSKRYSNGSITVYTNELKGLYKVYSNGSFYYAVEIPGQIFTGNFPTARMNNDLAFATSLQSGASNPRIFGNYVYFHVGNSAVNGSTLNREWGILTLLSDGRWSRQGYCNDTGSMPKLMPDEYAGVVPPANPSDSGAWSVNNIFPNRLNMVQFNSVDSITGFTYASDSGSVLVVDFGYNRGFLMGLKLQDGDQNAIKGSYGYADATYNRVTAGGKFSFNDTSHYVSWWRADSYGKVTNGVFGILYQCPVLKNVYYAKDVIYGTDTVDFYTLISGQYFLEFQFGNNKFRSCGMGGRLP